MNVVVTSVFDDKMSIAIKLSHTLEIGLLDVIIALRRR